MVAVVIVKIAAAVILAVATEIIGAGTPVVVTIIGVAVVATLVAATITEMVVVATLVAATITEMVVVAVTALAAILQIPTI